MTIRDRIIDYLKNHPEGIDDDDLAFRLGLNSRQQSSLRCRQLEREGLIKRVVIGGKIHNFWADNYYSTKTLNKTNISSLHKSNQHPQKITETQKSESWFWEGNVQSKVVSFLVSQKYQILLVADTASHQTGIDIIAEKNEKKLWVSVKGYPQGTEKTNASTQSRHWFKQAIFDIIEYRERDKEVLLAVAFPDFRTYRNLTKKITWLKSSARYVYLWVGEDGSVKYE
jgi:hypothetical protein